MSKQVKIHPKVKVSNGRRSVLSGTAHGAEFVSVLVFSHDEKWHGQHPVPVVKGRWEADVAFGDDPISPEGREYIVAAYIGPKLPPFAVFDSLNALPDGHLLSSPMSILRVDQLT